MKTEKDIWLFIDGGAHHKVQGDPSKGFNGAYAFIGAFAHHGMLKRFTSGGGYQADTTTPRMEFSALVSALQNTNLVLDEPELCEHYGEIQGGTLYVVCDAMNTVKTMTDWIHKWIALTIKKFGSVFKKQDSDEVAIYRKDGSNLVPVLNQDLIVAALRCVEFFIARKMKVKFIHINSHIAIKNLEPARIKFQDFNNMLITSNEFIELVNYNEAVDDLVQKYYKMGIEREKQMKLESEETSNEEQD